MYFISRADAGLKLAAELTHFNPAEVIVVALGEGAVLVGEQIARTLGCPLSLLLSENVQLPGERTPIGTVTQDGMFTYNTTLSLGEIDEYYAEFHGYLEDQKREKFEKMNRLMGRDGALEASMLKDQVVILVSDGLKTGTVLDAASLFLKPIRIKRLVIATPIASVLAVDHMHILADELHCLGVTENYISTNHYYEKNDLPTHEQTIEIIRQSFTNNLGKGLPQSQ